MTMLSWHFTLKRTKNSTKPRSTNLQNIICYDILYNGQIQQDSSKWLMMLIEVINKDLMSPSGSNNNSTGVSICNLVFWRMYFLPCMLTKIPIIWVKQCIIYYTYLYLFHAGINNARSAIKLRKPCFRCKKNTWHDVSNYIFQPPKYLSLLIGLNT